MSHPYLHLLLVLTALLPVAAQGQSYPSRPVRVIIPFPPGNTMDIMARLIAPKLAERLGHNVIVDNRAGASGQLGLELATRAAENGLFALRQRGRKLPRQRRV